jgi:TRAP-type mannitol/chloroaromatic compound transport system permease small subunit
MERYIHIVSRINEWVGRTASYLLIPITFITAYEVVMRYVFSKPTVWAWDLNIQLFAFLNMLGGGYTLLYNSHVNIDVIVSSLSPKRRALVDLTTSFFFFLGVTVLLIGGWQVGWMSWKVKEAMSTIWAPPIYPMKLIIPAGAFLVLIQGIAIFFQNLLILSGKEQRK